MVRNDMMGRSGGPVDRCRFRGVWRDPCEFKSRSPHQTESLALSENIKWGKRRKYERGHVQSIPSGKFLGYDKDEHGNLIINQAQAVIVKRIYQEFLGGYETYQIAKHLTIDKLPMVYGGKEWCPSHILRVLTNEKMKGDTRFQKT
jgi:hypothetical protein